MGGKLDNHYVCEALLFIQYKDENFDSEKPSRLDGILTTSFKSLKNFLWEMKQKLNALISVLKQRQGLVLTCKKMLKWWKKKIGNVIIHN